jgi:hypothetical protein
MPMNAFETRFGFAPLFAVLLLTLVAVVGWETGWGRRVAPAPEFAPVPVPHRSRRCRLRIDGAGPAVKLSIARRSCRRAGRLTAAGGIRRGCGGRSC